MLKRHVIIFLDGYDLCACCHYERGTSKCCSRVVSDNEFGDLVQLVTIVSDTLQFVACRRDDTVA